MNPPSDELLTDFMAGFYGYGNPRARWWFIGQEEGGAGSRPELSAHLEAWRDRGRKEFEDLEEFQTSKGVHKYFGTTPTFHPYWGRIARVLVCARGEARAPTLGRVLEVQGMEVGRASSTTCLAELLPLPKPNRTSWNYAEFSNLPSLADGDSYMDEVGAWRAAALRRRIEEVEPEAVFFGSTGAEFMPYWELIAGGPLERRRLMPRRFISLRRGRTIFVAMQNPSGSWPPNTYLEEIGRIVSEMRA